MNPVIDLNADSFLLSSITVYQLGAVLQRRMNRQEAFAPQLRPREVDTITSVATCIAKVSGLPGVGI
jgi:hypothetical protein